MFPFVSTRSVFLAMASSGLLAGCATTEYEKPGGSLWAPVTPPELQIRGLSPPTDLTKDKDPQPYSVEVKNGAGDVLYSGGVGKIEKNVPIWKLDGTYVITTIWTNRTTTTQTLKAAPEKPVDIVYDRLQELPQRRYQLVAVAERPPGASGAARAGLPAKPQYSLGGAVRLRLSRERLRAAEQGDTERLHASPHQRQRAFVEGDAGSPIFVVTTSPA